MVYADALGTPKHSRPSKGLSVLPPEKGCPSRERRCHMIYSNACPKCHGDLTMNQDGYGSYVSCLQCGLMRDIDAKPGTSKSSAVKPTWHMNEELLPKAA